jgi:hypothetical protein
MSNIKLRSKDEIINTLPDAATDTDVEYAKSVYVTCGNIIKNGFMHPHNPATYVGWLKLEDGTIVRLEGEERKGKNGKVNLALKGVTVPNDLAVQMGMADPSIPNYKSKETESFL